jgi:hypothetical protein
MKTFLTLAPDAALHQRKQLPPAHPKFNSRLNLKNNTPKVVASKSLLSNKFLTFKKIATNFVVH